MRPDNGLLHLYFNTEGRINRQTFWLRGFLLYWLLWGLIWILFFGLFASSTIVCAIEGDFDCVMASAGLLILFIFILNLLMMWTMLAVAVKRLHDRGKSGWFVLVWIIIGIIPIIGTAIAFIWAFIELGCLEGTPGANRHGDDPSPRPWLQSEPYAPSTTAHSDAQPIQGLSGQDYVDCPFCAEPIRSGATRCRYCQADLQVAPPLPPSPSQPEPPVLEPPIAAAPTTADVQPSPAEPASFPPPEQSQPPTPEPPVLEPPIVAEPTKNVAPPSPAEPASFPPPEQSQPPTPEPPVLEPPIVAEPTTNVAPPSPAEPASFPPPEQSQPPTPEPPAPEPPIIAAPPPNVAPPSPAEPASFPPPEQSQPPTPEPPAPEPPIGAEPTTNVAPPSPAEPASFPPPEQSQPPPPQPPVLEPPVVAAPPPAAVPSPAQTAYLPPPEQFEPPISESTLTDWRADAVGAADAVDAPSSLCLRVRETREYFVIQGAVVIGRGAEAHLTIADRYMSGIHAIARSQGAAGLTIEDQASTNGTYVNGVAVQTVVALREGDVVRMGSTDFEVIVELIEDDPTLSPI